MNQFFQSYLFAFVFWFGLSAGALGLRLLHDLVGGDWGQWLRPVLDSAADVLPWTAILFLPIPFGMHGLYAWTAQPTPYLNVPFFLIRCIIYFGLWWLLALRWAPRRAGVGLVIFTLTVSFAAIDWMMSLEAPWISTIYPVLVLMGFVQTALAFAIAVRLRLGVSTPLDFKKASRDSGNLLLTFTMLWAYMNFSQFLIQWSGNLPREIDWHLRRLSGPWLTLAEIIIAVQFVIPFVLLLGRRNKEQPGRLIWISGMVCAMSVGNVFWLIEPALRPNGPSFCWSDPVSFLLVGTVWIAFFRRHQRRGVSP